MEIYYNEKLKNGLQKTFGGRFEVKFSDTIQTWNGVEFDEEFIIRGSLNVNEVIGKNNQDPVASISIVITEMLRDGDDYMYTFLIDPDYDNWILMEVEEQLAKEINEVFPISVYFDFEVIGED